PSPLPGLGRVAARTYAGDHGAAPGRRRPRLMRARHPWLRRAVRLGSWLFLALVAWLLLHYARGGGWPAVGAALRRYKAAAPAPPVAAPGRAPRRVAVRGAGGVVAAALRARGRLARRWRGPARLQRRAAGAGGRAGVAQLRDLRLLRPRRAPLRWPRTVHAP